MKLPRNGTVSFPIRLDADNQWAALICICFKVCRIQTCIHLFSSAIFLFLFFHIRHRNSRKFKWCKTQYIVSGTRGDRRGHTRWAFQGGSAPQKIFITKPRNLSCPFFVYSCFRDYFFWFSALVDPGEGLC